MLYIRKLKNTLKKYFHLYILSLIVIVHLYRNDYNSILVLVLYSIL